MDELVLINTTANTMYVASKVVHCKKNETVKKESLDIKLTK